MGAALGTMVAGKYDVRLQLVEVLDRGGCYLYILMAAVQTF